MAGKYKITMTEYLDGRDLTAPLTRSMTENMCKLLVAVNILRDRYGKPLIVSSGYRPPEVNKAAGGKPNSAHMTCEAIDIADVHGELKMWILANHLILEELDIYLEDFAACPTWVHIQVRKPASGNRIFKP